MVKDFVQLPSNSGKREKTFNVFQIACLAHEGDIINPIVSCYHDVCPLWTFTFPVHSFLLPEKPKARDDGLAKYLERR